MQWSIKYRGIHLLGFDGHSYCKRHCSMVTVSTMDTYPGMNNSAFLICCSVPVISQKQNGRQSQESGAKIIWRTKNNMADKNNHYYKMHLFSLQADN